MNLSAITTPEALPSLDFHSEQLSFLHRFDSCKSIRELKQIHSHIIKTNSPPKIHQLLYTKIISHSCSSQFIDLGYVLHVFTKFSCPNISLYNSFIRYLSGSKSYLIYVLLLYCELLNKGLVPDNYTYPFILKACAKLHERRFGEMVHGHVIKNGFASDLFVVNTLMRFYVVCGDVDAVKKVFDRSPEWDLVSWTSLIQGYVNNGYWKEGVDVFFNMLEAGLRPDGMTMVVVLSTCGKLGDLRLCRKIHGYMQDQEMNYDVFVGNALVDVYLKCGDTEFARKLFDKMLVKNVVSWNCMISGLAQQGEFTEALAVFRQMQSQRVEPDDITLVSVLNSCANLGILELGKWVHAYIDRKCISVDTYIGNALIDMYAKSGSIDEALKIFQGMGHKDVFTYTAMIVGLAMHGQGENALELFSEMFNSGIKPNAATYVGVLAACCHAGLVKEGCKHFANMSRLYNIAPQIAHYGCVVDLLGRTGLVNEAAKFLENMPIEPDALIWGALLGACKIHGKIEVAERVMEKLSKTQLADDGAYTLMSNLYTSLKLMQTILHIY